MTEVKETKAHSEWASPIVVPVKWTPHPPSSFGVIFTMHSQPNNNFDVSGTPIQSQRRLNKVHAEKIVLDAIQKGAKYIEVTETIRVFRFETRAGYNVRLDKELFKLVYHYNCNHSTRCSECKQSFYSYESYPANPAIDTICSECLFYKHLLESDI